MSREIKFRAWNTETNKMLSSSRLKEMQVFALSELLAKETDNFLVIPTQDKYPLMQYTGLKDKNGVDIYDGDIVSLMDCEPSLYKIVWWENNFKYGVEYIGSDITNWQDENLEEFDSESIEVIGNIYENKELLEK